LNEREMQKVPSPTLVVAMQKAVAKIASLKRERPRLIHNKPGLNDGHCVLCPAPIIRIALRQDYDEKISISQY
jgi:hypothetical protein